MTQQLCPVCGKRALASTLSSKHGRCPACGLVLLPRPVEVEVFDLDYRARATDPDTSDVRMAHLKATQHERHGPILRALQEHGGGTYREVAEWTGIDGTVTSTDLAKLERAGLIERTGERRNGAMVRRVKP